MSPVTDGRLDVRPFLELAQRIRAWDGDLESAEHLREQLRGLQAGGPLQSDEARAISRVSDRARKGAKSADRARRARSDLPGLLNKGGLTARAAAVLVGDPKLGPWPYEAWDRIEESEGRQWLHRIVEHRVAVDPAIRDLTTALFRARRRVTWMESARALASLATRDAELLEYALTTWQCAFPEGLPNAWCGPLDPDASHRLGHDGVHLVRHALYLASLMVSAGLEVPGLDIGELARMPLPADPSDQSIVLFALLPHLTGELRGQLLPLLSARAPELLGRALPEGAGRHLLDHLGDAADAAGARLAWRAALIQARWRAPDGDTRDGLWAWTHTATWFKARGDQAAVEAMLGVAGPGAAAVRIALGEGDATDLSATAADRLRDLLDPCRALALPLERRGPAYAEALGLLGSPALAEVHWPSLVARALGPEAANTTLEGTVGEVGFAGLGLLMSQARAPGPNGDRIYPGVPGELARNLRLSKVRRAADGVGGRQAATRSHPNERTGELATRRKVALSLASAQDKALSRHVAIQIEQLLCAAPTDAERVRLVWQLLQRDPPGETFRQLNMVLRAGRRTGQRPVEDADRPPTTPPRVSGDTDPLCDRSTPLHRLVRQVAELDALREEQSLSKLAAAFERVAKTVGEYLPSDWEMGAKLRALGEALTRTAQSAQAPLDTDWLELLRVAVLGEEDDGGLVAWSLWIHGDDPAMRGSARGSFEGLRDAVTGALEVRPVVAAALLCDVQTARDDLLRSLSGLGWPEARVLTTILGEVVSQVSELVEEGRRAKATGEYLAGLLACGDEVGVLQLCGLLPTADEATATRRGRGSINQLSSDDLRTVHRFLLDRMLFSEAAALRKKARLRVQLPHFVRAFGPLLVGAAAGPLFVLDVGQEWLDSDARLLPTLLLAFGAPYALLAVDLVLVRRGSASRAPADRGAHGGARWKLGALPSPWARLLPAYVSAVLVAFAASALVTWSQGQLGGGLGARGLALWTGLSMSLGVFLHVVVAGGGRGPRDG